MSGNLHDFRQNYTQGDLLESQVLTDPVDQFDRWFHEASERGVIEPNAMSLATVDGNGQPRLRIVLLKNYSKHGFTYYTNMKSPKGVDVVANPRVSVLFFWIQMERQIRVDGSVTPLPRAEVESYFRTRPRESQIGAWASHQSEPVATREDLDRRFHEIERQYEGKPIPVPPHWGGYQLHHDRIEFWQGRSGRLHDRLEYILAKSGEWSIRRLQP